MQKTLKGMKDMIVNNKILRAIYNTVKTIITIILLMMLMVIIVQRVSNNSVSIGGIRIFMVVTGSMVPDYQVGDILISSEVDPATINVGDDVVYHGEKGEMAGLTITHRVVSKRSSNNEYYFVTKGTANEIADPEISASQVYGKIVYATVLFSALSRLLLDPTAYFAICIAVGLIISFQMVKVIFDERREEEDDDKEE